MPQLLTRPPVAHGPAAGVLMAEHFQVAYYTNDIDRACDLFAGRLGIREFRRLEGQMPTGGHIRVELAWVGTVMYELMTTRGAAPPVYDGFPQTGEPFEIRHHHLGYVVTQPQWDAVLAEAARQGYAVPFSNDNPGFLKACFVKAPELPHFLEYICPEPAGIEFFENVPRH